MAKADPARRALLAGAAAVLALPPWLSGAAGAWAACVFPEDGVSRFRAEHGGETVGRRLLSLERSPGEGLLVRHELSVEIGPPGRRLRAVRQRCEEVWKAGWLQSLASDSEIDGKAWSLRAERRGAPAGSALEGEVNGHGFTVSGYVVTTTFWHRDAPTQQALLDVTDGRVKLIEGFLTGIEQLTVAGEPRPARHFTLRGEIRRQLWYGEDCRLLRIAEPLADGSALVYRLA